MKPEEIEIFKDIRAVLSEAIDKLEALEAEKKPREFWLETMDGEIIDVHDKKPKILRVFNDFIHVQEVIE